jgi:hypothetical protein
MISWDEGNETHNQPIMDRQARLFATQEEADALAFELARVWIAERG